MAAWFFSFAGAPWDDFVASKGTADKAASTTKRRRIVSPTMWDRSHLWGRTTTGTAAVLPHRWDGSDIVGETIRRRFVVDAALSAVPLLATKSSQGASANEKNQAAIPRRSCRQLPAPRGAQGSPRPT